MLKNWVPPPKKNKKKIVKFTIDQKKNPKISLFFFVGKTTIFFGKKETLGLMAIGRTQPRSGWL